jgi:hypothetical protein
MLNGHAGTAKPMVNISSDTESVFASVSIDDTDPFGSPMPSTSAHRLFSGDPLELTDDDTESDLCDRLSTEPIMYVIINHRLTFRMKYLY